MKPIGLVNGVPAFNPGNYSAANPGSFDTGEAQMGGLVYLSNVSCFDLIIWFDDQIAQQYTLHAWQPRLWNLEGKQRKTVNFYPAFTPPPGVINNAPASYIWGESYMVGEPFPMFFPADARINTVGNVVTTTGSSQTLQNDGNPPGTQVIETTPSDQASSSLAINNDGSGFWKVLSAGVLRTFFSILRGNATTGKAILQLGATADVTILTIYGTLDSTSVVPVACLSGTIPASQIGSGYPGANVSGNVFQATNLNSTFSASDFGSGTVRQPTLFTNSTSGDTYDYYVQTFDGSAAHRVLLVDHTGLRYADAAGISGSVADAQQVDSTNAGSTTTPQWQGGANAGLSIKDNNNGTLWWLEINPARSGDTHARGVRFDFMDSGGTLHQGMTQDSIGTTGIGVLDNGTATYRIVRKYIGTTDPSTYATMNEGDEWDAV